MCSYLNVFSDCVEHLLGHADGFEEVLLTTLINHILPWIIPVEIADGLLQIWDHPSFSVSDKQNGGGLSAVNGLWKYYLATSSGSLFCALLHSVLKFSNHLLQQTCIFHSFSCVLDRQNEKFLGVESVGLPGPWADSPRWRWWCWPLCCFQFESAGSSGSLWGKFQSPSFTKIDQSIDAV